MLQPLRKIDVLGEVRTEIYFAYSPLPFLFLFNIPRALFQAAEISLCPELTK